MARAFDDPTLEAEFQRAMVTRYRRSAQILILVLIGFFAAFLPTDLIAGNPTATWARVTSLVVLVPTVLLLLRADAEGFRRRVAPVSAIVILTFVAYFFVMGRAFADDVGASSNGLAGLLLAACAIGVVGQSLVSFRFIIGLTAFQIAAGTVFASGAPGMHPLAVFAYGVTITMAGALGVLVAHSLQQARRTEFVQRRELEHERARSDALLHNILPAEIAGRLKHQPGIIAERFEDATVMFADLVGFTSLSEKLPPEEVVTMLDRIFSAFDELAARHGLEKIKTIGDAYMVVGGLPVARADHTEAVAAMATEMRAIVGEQAASGRPLQLRIGIACGPVVAGVIGKTKLVYDLWGDTVNTASRMESHGIEGAIHVTAEVAARLQGRFATSSRGRIAIKGKGEMETFVLDAITA